MNGHFSKVVKGDLMMEIPKTAEVWDALGLRFKFFHFQVIPISILSLEKKSESSESLLLMLHARKPVWFGFGGLCNQDIFDEAACFNRRCAC